MAELYLIANGPAPTVAAQAAVTTSATLATMLQVKMGASNIVRAKVVEWGVSFDGSAAATPFACELIAATSASVGATVTAHVAAGIVNLDPLATAPTDTFPFDFGTTETGYTSSLETAPTNVRMLDVQYVAPTNQYVHQWPLGREPGFKVSEYLRVRIWGDGTRKVYCYVVIEV